MPKKSVKTLCPIEFASQRLTKGWIKDIVAHNKNDLSKKIDFSRPFSNSTVFVKFLHASKLSTWKDDELLELPMVMLQALDRVPQSYLSCHMANFVNLVAVLANKPSYHPVIDKTCLIAHIFPVINKNSEIPVLKTRLISPAQVTVRSTTSLINASDYQRQFQLVNFWNSFLTTFTNSLLANGHKIDNRDDKISYGVAGCFFNKTWEKKEKLSQGELLTALAETFGIMLFAISTNCSNLDEAKIMLGKFHQFRISRSWPSHKPNSISIKKLTTLVGNNYNFDDIILSHYLSDARSKTVNFVAKYLSTDTQKDITTRKLVIKNIEHLFYCVCVGRVNNYSFYENRYIHTLVNGITACLPAGSTASNNWARFIEYLTTAIKDGVCTLGPCPTESSNLLCAILTRTNMHYNKSKVKTRQLPDNKFESTAFQTEIDSNDGTLSDLSTIAPGESVAPAIDIRPLNKISAGNNFVDVDDLASIEIFKIVNPGTGRTVLRPVVSRNKNKNLSSSNTSNLTANSNSHSVANKTSKNTTMTISQQSNPENSSSKNLSEKSLNFDVSVNPPVETQPKVLSVRFDDDATNPSNKVQLHSANATANKPATNNLTSNPKPGSNANFSLPPELSGTIDLLMSKINLLTERTSLLTTQNQQLNTEISRLNLASSNKATAEQKTSKIASAVPETANGATNPSSMNTAEFETAELNTRDVDFDADSVLADVFGPQPPPSKPSSSDTKNLVSSDFESTRKTSNDTTEVLVSSTSQTKSGNKSSLVIIVPSVAENGSFKSASSTGNKCQLNASGPTTRSAPTSVTSGNRKKSHLWVAISPKSVENCFICKRNCSKEKFRCMVCRMMTGEACLCTANEMLCTTSQAMYTTCRYKPIKCENVFDLFETNGDTCYQQHAASNPVNPIGAIRRKFTDSSSDDNTNHNDRNTPHNRGRGNNQRDNRRSNQSGNDRNNNNIGRSSYDNNNNNDNNNNANRQRSSAAGGGGGANNNDNSDNGDDNNRGSRDNNNRNNSRSSRRRTRSNSQNNSGTSSDSSDFRKNRGSRNSSGGQRRRSRRRSSSRRNSRDSSSSQSRNNRRSNNARRNRRDSSPDSVTRAVNSAATVEDMFKRNQRASTYEINNESILMDTPRMKNLSMAEFGRAVKLPYDELINRQLGRVNLTSANLDLLRENDMPPVIRTENKKAYEAHKAPTYQVNSKSDIIEFFIDQFASFNLSQCPKTPFDRLKTYYFGFPKTHRSLFKIFCDSVNEKNLNSQNLGMVMALVRHFIERNCQSFIWSCEKWRNHLENDLSWLDSDDFSTFISRFWDCAMRAFGDDIQDTRNAVYVTKLIWKKLPNDFFNFLKTNHNLHKYRGESPNVNINELIFSLKKSYANFANIQAEIENSTDHKYQKVRFVDEKSGSSSDDENNNCNFNDSTNESDSDSDHSQFAFDRGRSSSSTNYLNKQNNENETNSCSEELDNHNNDNDNNYNECDDNFNRNSDVDPREINSESHGSNLTRRLSELDLDYDEDDYIEEDYVHDVVPERDK